MLFGGGQFVRRTLCSFSIRLDCACLVSGWCRSFADLKVAVLFMLYELAGVVTNLLAGIAGAKWGLKATLLSGLTLQLIGIGSLYAWDDECERLIDSW